MITTVNGKEFGAALTDAKRFMDKKISIPVLGCVQLVADGETVTLTATNLEVALTVNLGARVSEPGTVLIPLATLISATKGVKGLITLETFDEPKPAEETATTESTGPTTDTTAPSAKPAPVQWNGKVMVCGALIPTLDPLSYPELPQPTGAGVMIPVSELQRAIARTYYAISAEESRFTLNGARVEFGAQGLRMVATDGHRLALADVAAGSFKTAVTMFPKRLLAELLKLKPGAVPVVNWFQDENHLFFIAGARTIISRKLTGNFPDYKRVFPKHAAVNVLSVPRVELLTVCERLSAIQKNERQPALTFRLNGAAIVENRSYIETSFSATLTGAQWFTEYAQGYRGHRSQEFTVGVNPVYLVDWLKSTDVDTVKIRFQNAKDAIQLESAPDYQSLVMPLRV